MTTSTVVVLDYGSGNVRSAVRAVQRVGAQVQLTADWDAAFAADGLVVPGVGNFSACVAGLRAVRGPELVDRRLVAGRPVLGICVGHQVMFEKSAEPHRDGVLAGLGQWPGTVDRLPADVVPHTGWNTVQPPSDTVMFRGLQDAAFYFVHSYAVLEWPVLQDADAVRPPRPTWSSHGTRFVAAVEHGLLSATQFHPEKSGDAGAQLLENWVRTLAR
ncbi:MAG: imidazole glycerol phosphate synthase subunit HisH [Angustibacter sp.]